MGKEGPFSRKAMAVRPRSAISAPFLPPPPPRHTPPSPCLNTLVGTQTGPSGWKLPRTRSTTTMYWTRAGAAPAGAVANPVASTSASTIQTTRFRTFIPPASKCVLPNDTSGPTSPARPALADNPENRGRSKCVGQPHDSQQQKEHGLHRQARCVGHDHRRRDLDARDLDAQVGVRGRAGGVAGIGHTQRQVRHGELAVQEPGDAVRVRRRGAHRPLPDGTHLEECEDRARNWAVIRRRQARLDGDLFAHAHRGRPGDAETGRDGGDRPSRDHPQDSREDQENNGRLHATTSCARAPGAGSGTFASRTSHSEISGKILAKSAYSRMNVAHAPAVIDHSTQGGWEVAP